MAVTSKEEVKRYFDDVLSDDESELNRELGDKT